MPFSDSYLGRMREIVGHALLVSPGVQVVLVDSDGAVLVQRRSDSSRWELPAGACEPDQSFATAAVAEVAEETGIAISADELTAFATLSDPERHTLVYPNGDVVRAFALCFWVHAAGRQPRIVDGEAVEHRWVLPDAVPEPVHPPTRAVLAMYAEYRATGRFIAG